MQKSGESTSISSKINTAQVYLVIVIVIWGINYTVGRLLSAAHPVLGPDFATARVSGVLYGFSRYLFGFLIMITVLVYQRKGFRTISTEIKPYRKILLISAVLSAIFIVTAHASSEFINSGTTSIIINMCPVIVLIYGVLFLQERLTRKKVIGFILGITGGLFFLWNSIIETSTFNTVGILLSLIAMITWAAYTVCLHYLEGGDSYIIMTVKHFSSTLMIIPFLFIYALNEPLVLIIDIWTVVGLLFAGIVASGLAYILYFKAIEILGAPRTSSVLFLIPVVSVAGDMILQELPGVITLLAGLIAITGVALINSNVDKD
ncbi:MAG: DMT family transporter [Candidatus Hodarchaeales archaeon]